MPDKHKSEGDNFRTIRAFTRIARLGKVQGREGGLKIFPMEGMEEAVAGAAFLFIDRNGSKVPYALEGIEFPGDLVVKLRHIDTPEQATELVSADVFLPSEELDIEPVEEEKLEYSWVEGYRLTDQRKGLIGMVLEVREFPQQEMAVVIREGKEVLIPLNDTFILRIDEEGREIVLQLPEGLMEL